MPEVDPDWEWIKALAMRVRKHLMNHYNDLIHRSSCDTCMAYFIGEQMGKADDVPA